MLAKWWRAKSFGRIERSFMRARFSTWNLFRHNPDSSSCILNAPKIINVNIEKPLIILHSLRAHVECVAATGDSEHHIYFPATYESHAITMLRGSMCSLAAWNSGWQLFYKIRPLNYKLHCSCFMLNNRACLFNVDHTQLMSASFCEFSISTFPDQMDSAHFLCRHFLQFSLLHTYIVVRFTVATHSHWHVMKPVRSQRENPDDGLPDEGGYEILHFDGILVWSTFHVWRLTWLLSAAAAPDKRGIYYLHSPDFLCQWERLLQAIVTI